MIWIYRIIYLPVLLLLLPYYLARMWKRGGYRDGFFHRFGFFGPLPKRREGLQRIWIQAVSVGELTAIEALLDLLHLDGRFEVVLTTTTSTGLRLTRQRYADRIAAAGVFPLDFWLFSYLAWNRIKPDIAIVLELELWPEHLHQATNRQVPVILANARLSDRSFHRYSVFPRLISRFLNRLHSILPASRFDGERFQALGADPQKLHVTGNLKCDIRITPRLTESEIEEIQRELGFLSEIADAERPLIMIGSSTWRGEEDALVETLRNLINEGLFCRLILVPRHAERRAEIEKLLRRTNFTYHLRSSGQRAPDRTFIYLADTTGDLRMLTQAADLAFIGKSLPPHTEGQTPIEAALLGIPILFGPGMSSFKNIAESLQDCGAAEVVESPEQLHQRAGELLKDKARRAEMVQVAGKWERFHRGATKKTLEQIEAAISRNQCGDQ